MRVRGAAQRGREKLEPSPFKAAMQPEPAPPAAAPVAARASEAAAVQGQQLPSPFQVAAQGARSFSSETDAPPSQGAAAVLQTSPSRTLSPRHVASLNLHVQRSLPSRRGSPMALEAGRPGSPSHSSGFGLQRVLSCLTPEELCGPSEVRMLLPGVDLRAHGMEEEVQTGALRLL